MATYTTNRLPDQTLFILTRMRKACRGNGILAKTTRSFCGAPPNNLPPLYPARTKSSVAKAVSVVALTVLAAVLLAGCASVGPGGVLPVPPTAKEATGPSQNGWWYARFVMNWPADKEPSWYIDPLLAHRVVSPVLDRYGNDIVLWRFHRRAARDQAGHQFSFIFYATPETAREVFAVLQANAMLQDLKDRGVIVRVSCDDTTTITRPNLEDTSDRTWSLPIQKSWPFYIMGVSEMWLNLIREVAGQVPSGGPPSNLDDALGFYRQVNASIDQMWRDEGQHAFLHHLNAIFGYEPLMVREKRPMNF
jgi:hypothetical protein